MKKFLQTIMAIMLIIGVFVAPSIALADCRWIDYDNRRK